jgi:hypothetical protein
MVEIAENPAQSNVKINWNKRQEPFIEKLYRSIDYLEHRARNCNAITANRTIEKIVADGRKYQFFKKFFPEEWKSSRASLFKAGFYENYSERVNELFVLISKNMFPLLSGWNDGDPEAEFENFFIFSLNLDLCCEDFDYEDLRVCYVAGLLFYIEEDAIWEYFAENYQINKDEFPVINERPDDKLWNIDRTGDLGLYLNIFELVDHSTGNPWLDTTNCRGSDCYSWDENTLLFLTESYKEAEGLLEKAALLDEVFEADPKRVLQEMISLWNEGRIKQDRKRRGKQSAKN